MAGPVKKPRGFAAIDPERAKQIRQMGGKASPNKFTSEKAKLAGIKGREKRYGKKYES